MGRAITGCAASTIRRAVIMAATCARSTFGQGRGRLARGGPSMRPLQHAPRIQPEREPGEAVAQAEAAPGREAAQGRGLGIEHLLAAVLPPEGTIRKC